MIMCARASQNRVCLQRCRMPMPGDMWYMMVRLLRSSSPFTSQPLPQQYHVEALPDRLCRVCLKQLLIREAHDWDGHPKASLLERGIIGGRMNDALFADHLGKTHGDNVCGR